VFHLVAIAASAGGLTALATILAQLPPDFPLPIALVQHVDPNHVSMIADILGRRTELTVKPAKDGDTLVSGIVYVAPPARHFEVGAGGTIALNSEQPVHFLRPSADRLFASAAHVFGPIIGVVLTGTGSDGTDGARAIRAAGGLVIAQDEASSAFFGMPHAAIDAGVVDRVLALGEIAPALRALTEAYQS
jgi:two-component system chemotaxis response regulator CheB